MAGLTSGMWSVAGSRSGREKEGEWNEVVVVVDVARGAACSGTTRERTHDVRTTVQQISYSLGHHMDQVSLPTFELEQQLPAIIFHPLCRQLRLRALDVDVILENSQITIFVNCYKTRLILPSVPSLRTTLCRPHPSPRIPHTSHACIHASSFHAMTYSSDDAVPHPSAVPLPTSCHLAPVAPNTAREQNVHDGAAHPDRRYPAPGHDRKSPAQPPTISWAGGALL